MSVASDSGLAVDVRAWKNDSVFALWNISPPASRGDMGVATTGIAAMSPPEVRMCV